VLLSSHLLAEVQATADRLVIIDRGRVVASGTQSSLLVGGGRTLEELFLPLTTLGWSWPELAGFAAFVVLTSGIGMAVGSALHNTAAAIVTYFALAAASSLLLIPAVQKAGSWIDTSQTFGWMLTGQWSGHGPQIASSVVIWIAVPLAIGAVRTVRRDIR